MDTWGQDIPRGAPGSRSFHPESALGRFLGSELICRGAPMGAPGDCHAAWAPLWAPGPCLLEEGARGPGVPLSPLFPSEALARLAVWKPPLSRNSCLAEPVTLRSSELAPPQIPQDM